MLIWNVLLFTILASAATGLVTPTQNILTKQKFDQAAARGAVIFIDGKCSLVAHNFFIHMLNLLRNSYSQLFVHSVFSI